MERCPGFLCFRCNRKFFTSKQLIEHLKVNYPYLSEYKCKQDQCFRSFRDLNGLRKHLVNKHLKGIIEVDIASPNKRTNESTCELDLPIPTKFDTTEPDSTNVLELNSNLTNKSNECNFLPSLIKFISQLYNNPVINRGIVQEVVVYTQELTHSIFSFLLHSLKEIKDISQLEPFLDEALKKVTNDFGQIQTEYVRFKLLEKHKLLIKPKSVNIGNEMVLNNISTPGQSVPNFKNVSSQKICIITILKQFLELPRVFETIKDFMFKEETALPDILTSCFQGNLWKEIKTKFLGKTVLPLFLFFDDFEPLNVLGSRSGNYKIGAVYISLACLPPEFSSLLENIFLGQLFYSTDRTVHGNKKMFQKLIDDLKTLEENGIEIDTSCGKIKVYFCLLAILGDNLGLNSVLGFTESFNSDFYCRICIAPKVKMQTDWKVSYFVIRTQDNYDLDCEHHSRDVKELAVWNELKSFNVTQNFSCDLMHNMLLGILRYDMAFIINYLINVKYFTLHRLNERIKFFKYSKVDAGSVMPQIKQEHLKKNLIIISASEMMSLTLYFGILVGDLVPEDDDVWKFYSLTAHLLENLLARSFTEASIMYLQRIIEEHHELISILFKEHLRPKYHFLLHYPLIINLLGPPRYFWSMRYESFHKLLKNTANSVTCRRNLLITLSIK